MASNHPFHHIAPFSNTPSTSSYSSPPSSSSSTGDAGESFDSSPRSSRHESLASPPLQHDTINIGLFPDLGSHHQRLLSSSDGGDGSRSSLETYPGEEIVSYSSSQSRVSSRAASPVPQENPHWDQSPRADLLSFRSISRNRSRNGSGTTTPVLGLDKEGQYGSECTSSASKMPHRDS